MDYLAELNLVNLKAKSIAKDVLSELGASDVAHSYVSSLRAYGKFPHFSTMWIQDDQDRISTGVVICLHAIGIKLWDDLLDLDSGLDIPDLSIYNCILEEAHIKFSAFKSGPKDYSFCLPKYGRYFDSNSLRFANLHQLLKVGSMTVKLNAVTLWRLGPKLQT